MAIKVRCQQCRKKVSLDEAFAGGVCRCPYCKAITMVSGGGAVSHAARPDRPDSPTAASQGRQVESVEVVPLAKPVMIQGIVTLVLSAFVLLLLVVGVFLVVKISTGPDKQPAPNGGPDPVANGTNGTNGTDVNGDDDLPTMPDPTNPFTARGRHVAGMVIATPVVYIIDASSGMRDLYDPAVAVVRYSIRAMGRVGQFNVIVLSEEAAKPLAGTWTTGGDAGDAKAKQFMRASQPAGATDLAEGFRRALAMKPRTVVVLTGKAVGGADELAQQAKRAGVGIFAVMLEAPPDAVKVMKKLTAATSGKCRQFTGDEIADSLSEATPLP